MKRERVFQYTALDDCTRLRVLRLYSRQNQHSSIHFLDELRRALPFPIKKLQCDNGSEFPIAFKLAVEAAQKTGRAAGDLVEDALAGYFEELGELRSTLDARYDELKAGHVRLIDAETAANRLKAKSEERRNPAGQGR